MRKTLPIALAALLASGQAWGYDAFADIRSFTYSEPVSIDALLNGVEGSEFEGGDRAFTHNFVEAGIRHGDWAWSLFYRYDYLPRFTADTARYYFEKENALAHQGSYDLGLEVNHFQGTGIAVSRRLSLHPHLSIGFKGMLIQGHKLTDGHISGSSVIDGEEDLRLALDYIYSEDQLLDRQVTRPDGLGLSLDFYARWKVTDKLTTSLSAYDLISRLRWRDAPYTIARYPKDNANDPAVRAGYADHSQRLPRHYELRARYQPGDDWQVYGVVIASESVTLPRMGIRKMDGLHAMAVEIEPETGAVGIQYDYGKNIVLYAKSDNLDLEDAHSVALGVRLSYPLE